MNIFRNSLFILCFVIQVIGCQSQYNPYDEFQFRDIILCQGLNEDDEPITVSETITSKTNLINLCINVETDREFFFSLALFGPISPKRMVIKAQKSEWLVTTLTNRGNNFPAGEYRIEIRVFKTRKATKTFEVVESGE